MNVSEDKGRVKLHVYGRLSFRTRCRGETPLILSRDSRANYKTHLGCDMWL